MTFGKILVVGAPLGSCLKPLEDREIVTRYRCRFAPLNAVTVPGFLGVITESVGRAGFIPALGSDQLKMGGHETRPYQRIVLRIWHVCKF